MNNTRQRVIFTLLGITIGYVFHDFAYDSSQMFLKSIHFIPSKSSHQTVLGDSSSDQFMTAVSYDGKQFEPKKVYIRKGNYVVITNRSKTALLWLQSDMPDVNTTRGYAEGEQFRFASQRVGSFTISNKVNPQSTLRLIVGE